MEIEVCIDGQDLDRLAAFWSALLGYRELGATGPYRALGPVEPGTGPRLVLQRVPEVKVGKNRVHLDVYVPLDELAAELERALALGATPVSDGEVHEGDERWFVLADPEGNELCLCAR